MLGLGSQIYDATMARCLDLKRAVEPGPAVRVDLGVEPPLHLEVASWSKLKRDEVTCPGAQPWGSSPPDHGRSYSFADRRLLAA